MKRPSYRIKKAAMGNSKIRHSDILQAAKRIEGEAFRTPLLQSEVLNRLTGAHVLLKPENLQRTGSFKFRGAYNAIASLTPAEKQKGVVASSSGNHAQGVAEAARQHGVAATIVMPADAPKMKIERTRKSGAEIIHYDRATEDRDVVVGKVLEKTGCVEVHPFNNVSVIAGQGTVGEEIAQDVMAKGKQIDRVLVCTGGGGLTAGVALAVSHHFPEAKIHPVEPQGFDDYARSLKSGKLERNAKTAGSICDAVIVVSPGAIGFEINQELAAEGLIVTDDEALNAVRFAWEELKLVVEPGGAIALAALLQNANQWKGETIAVVLSGGNVDGDLFASTITA